MTSSIYLIGDTSDVTDDVVAQLSASQLGLLILEAGNISVDVNDLDGDGQFDDYVLINPNYTRDELVDLIGGAEEESRSVLAYVNTVVPDFNRFYWDTSWVTPDPDDPTDLDFGTINEDAAPAWLIDNLGRATGPEFGPNGERGDDTFGFLANYRDEVWQQQVITQAVAYVEHGYTGLFLDDVGRYDETTLGVSAAAEAMMRFVVRIEEEVTQATGISAEELNITVNSDSYIISNYFFAEDAPETFDLQLVSDFISAVDGLVMENTTTATTDFWGVGNQWFNGTVLTPTGEREGETIINGATTQLTAIETPQEWGVMQDILAELAAANVSLFLARDQAYNDVLDAPTIGSAGDDTLSGSELGEAIFGLGGADSIDGGGGDDILYGGSLDATIYGGDGNDLIYGGPGDDLIFAGAGDDTIYGGGGNDTIIGGDGSDIIFGDAGNDLISGGASGDVLSGGTGDDILYVGELPDSFDFGF